MRFECVNDYHPYPASRETLEINYVSDDVCELTIINARGRSMQVDVKVADLRKFLSC